MCYLLMMQHTVKGHIGLSICIVFSSIVVIPSEAKNSRQVAESDLLEQGWASESERGRALTLRDETFFDGSKIKTRPAGMTLLHLRCTKHSRAVSGKEPTTTGWNVSSRTEGFQQGRRRSCGLFGVRWTVRTPMAA